MADPPKTGTKSPGTAKVANPVATATDSSGRMTTTTKAKKTSNGTVFTQGSIYRDVTATEKAKRIAVYLERVGRSKYKLVYGTDAYGKMMSKRKALAGPPAGCRPDLRAFVPGDARLPIHKNAQGDWLCQRTIDSAITFRERKYQNQENDFRVFIEGAEVTPYVEGSISWTTESTGGVNTCRFVLNNTQDAFIITPTNVCAGPYNTNAWRMSSVRKGKSNSLYINTGTYRNSWRVDEVAKWQIYKRKYEAVNPNHEKKQIDSFTGMWLYPLNPFSCIFNKHDAVRVFVRLPHVTSQHKPRTKSWYDLWMPAFTGFIDRYSWTDAPVEGKRTVNITCYDYRGLMERMRVRVYSMPAGDGGQTERGGTTAQTTGERGPGKPNSEKNTPSHRNKAYLTRAIQRGTHFEAQLKQVFLSAKSTKLYANVANPYDYGARGFHLEDTYIDLHTLWVKKGTDEANGGRGCGVGGRAADTRGGRFSVAGKQYDQTCAGRILASVDSEVSGIAVSMTNALGYLLQSIMVIFDLVGEAYIIYADARDIKPAVSAGQAPSKAKRVVLLHLKNIAVTDGNAQTGNKGKSQSVVALAKNAGDLIKKKIKTPFTEAANIYSAAFFYNAALQTTQGTGGGIAKTAARYTAYKTSTGWGPWVTAAAKTGVISATWNPTELAKKPPNVVMAEFEKIMRAYEDQVEKQLVTRTNRILAGRSRLGTVGPLIVGGKTPTLDRRIKIERKNQATIDKAILKAQSVGDTKEVARLTAAKINSDALVAKLDVRKNNPVSSNAQTSWQDLLGYKKWPLFDQIKSSVSAEFLGSFTANELASKAFRNKFLLTAELGDKAVSAMGSYIAAITDGWASSYSILQTNANNLAKKLHRDANRQLERKKKSDPRKSDTYKSFVQAGADKRSGVNIADALYWMSWKREQLKKSVKGGTSVRALRNTIGLIQAIRAQTSAGQEQLKRSKSVADSLLKFAHFETRQAGIFADLVTAVGIQPHPLMGKSLEASIEYLCCEQQRIIPGVITSVDSYKNGGGKYVGIKKPGLSDPARSNGQTILDAWNRTVLFGVVGRPMTWPEVSVIGRGTITDFRSAFSPFNVFYHLLKPRTGTGASTLIQMSTGTTTINSLNVAYETRKKLLDDICSVVDYQYWVSGIGDLIFEMPHYNSMPADFGKVVEQAYTLNKDWTNATIAEEAQDIPTAWVVTGQHVDKKNESTKGSQLVSNFFKTVVIMAPILARRLGVRVENINLKIPGLGGVGDVQQNKKGKQVGSTTPQQAEDQLNIYAYFHIQRQLGRAHTLQVDMPFRPYVVPNRPIWFVPRQRIGLVRSVTHTMNPPMGACSTEMNLGYTRWLFRDGTFRFVAGGPRQPVSYMSFFTGIPPRKSPKEGTLNEDKATLRDNTGTGCTGNLSAVAKQSSAFSTAVATQWGVAYSTPMRLSRPSLPTTDAVDLASGGLRESLQSSPTAPTSVTLTQATKARGSNGLNLMNPIWAQTPGNNYNSGFNGFGYLRYWNSGGGKATYKDPNLLKKGSGGGDIDHTGWDIPTQNGTPCKTPIDVLKAEAKLEVGAWRFYPGQTVWAKVGGAKSERSQEALLKFAVKPVVKSIETTTKNTYIRIWSQPYAIYRALGGTKSGIKITHGSSSGLSLKIEGYTRVPKMSSGRLLVQLTYVHLSDIIRLPTGKKDKDGKDAMAILGGKGLQTPARSSPFLLAANSVVGYAGDTGCGGAHLHLTMRVRNRVGNNYSSEDQLRVTIAANKEFLDAQLRARAEFFNYEGRDPRNELKSVNEAAAKYWQSKRIKGRLGAKGKTVTIQDVVKYYQKRRTYRNLVPELGGKKGNGWFRAHAGYFFTVSQLIDDKRLQSREARYQKVLHIMNMGKAVTSEKYQQAYRSFCQGAATKALERLSNERGKCTKGRNSTMTGVYKNISLVGKPLATVQARQKKCINNVQEKIFAVHSARTIVLATPVGSRVNRRSAKFVRVNAKISKRVMDSKIKALQAKIAKAPSGYLKGATANFVKYRG